MLRPSSRIPAIAWLSTLVAALSIILSATRGGTGSRTKQKSFLFVAAASAKEDNSQEEHTVSRSFESFGVGTGRHENQDYESFNRRYLTNHQAFQFSASAHACLLAYDMVQCVGYNYYGQIGQSSSSEFGSPVQLMFPGITSAKPIKVVTGYDHTCTLFTDKHVWCNGSNGFGQLGSLSTGNSATPVQVQEGDSILVDVVDIAAGAYHNCAIKSTRAMYCWGFNVDGQLGMKSIMDGSSTGKKAVQMALSMSATCVVTEQDSSKVNCVGFDYSNTDKAFTVVDLGSAITTQTGKQGLTAGSSHFCALLDNTKAKCWGTNHRGQLGIGSAEPTSAYYAVAGYVLQGPSGTELVGITDIKAGYSSTCIVVSGSPLCFGNNRSYQLGIVNGGANALFPTLVTSIDNITGKSLLSMHVGEYTGHAVFDDNSVYSVGTNRGGTFGDSSTISSQNIIGDASTDIAKQISFVIGSDEPSFLPSTLPSDLPSSEPIIQWIPVASKGSLYDANGNVDANQFRTIWALSPNQILHRKCHDCISSHQDIYYRRFDDVSGLPSNLDLLETVKSSWFDSPHNSFNVDFKLYSSYVDALNDTNAWTFCNFNDPGVGFPRDCGPTGPAAWQFNSFTGKSGSVSNVGFYVETYSDFTRSGGDYTESGLYGIHTFTSSGTFTVNSGTRDVEFIIIGGGGSGGIATGDCGGGGGGAGGYISSVVGELSGGGCSPVDKVTVTSGSYPIVVGAGGAAVVGHDIAGSNGGDSSAFGHTAIGGGGGSNRHTSHGKPGGSGGGGSCIGYNGSGVSCQGYQGGGGQITPSGGTFGGGGAGGFDSTVLDRDGGPGGAGVISSITGVAVGRAGGGGGGDGTSTTGPGGSATHGGGVGGGRGFPGTSGAPNSGGGGGGAGYLSTSTTSGAGGSGVVILRYLLY